MKSFKENIILHEKYRVPQSRESREIFGETETTEMAPRRDQSRGLESWLQKLCMHMLEKKRGVLTFYIHLCR